MCRPLVRPVYLLPKLGKLGFWTPRRWKLGVSSGLSSQPFRRLKSEDYGPKSARKVSVRLFQQTSKILERKPSGTANPSVRLKGKRTQRGRVVESRYLDYEKKDRKDTSVDPSQTRGKVPEGGKKVGPLHKGRADSGNRRELQSTMLEGHSLATPQDLNLDLSAIHDTSRPRKTVPLDKTTSKKARSTVPVVSQKKSPDHQEMMDMIESQTLLLSLLTMKMENNVVRLEVEGSQRLSALGREQERLQWQAQELRRAYSLHNRKQALAAQLDAQEEMLRPFLAVVDRFREQYHDMASALDSTRHELPIHSVHLPGDGMQLLDVLQPELLETQRLLREFGADPTVGENPVLGLLSELRTASQEKDAQLCRYFSQVLELDAEASKEAALGNQQAWEEAMGPGSSRWYFSPDNFPAEPVG